MNINLKPKLTAAKVRALHKPGKYGDMNGLVLRITASGARSWIQRISIHGQMRDMGLGGFPEVTLAEARARAFENRRIARAGGDPRQSKTVPTFRKAASIVHEHVARAITNEKYAAQWFNQIERLAFPTIGDSTVDVIRVSQIISVLEPIWIEKAKTANELRGRMERIFDWAIAYEHRTAENPARKKIMEAALGPQNRVVKHHAALSYQDAPKAVQAIRQSDKPIHVRLATEFLMLTAVRTGEAREADWQEIVLESRTWTIPKGRMKARKDHRIPLCARAVEILLEARGKTRKPTGKVFPGISEGSMLSFIKSLGFGEITTHGMRTTMRTWVAECTDTREDVAEAALAHVERNNVKAAYKRTDLFDMRRVLTDEWCRYLTGS